MASLQEMKQNTGAAVTAPANHPILSKTTYLDKRKDLLGAGLPSHMTVEREIRTATVMLMNSKDLQAATPDSFYNALSIAVNSGIGLGNGKGYLVAYKGKVSYVPGWKGLVDLVSRSGRANVWTGVIHQGDHFKYALGDSPYLEHIPGDNDDHKQITHYYAVGRVKGSDYPIIEVWSVAKVIKHLNKYNKVGTSHYAHKDDNNMEMYARKVVLLQVLKYLPQSQDIENAIVANEAADTNKGMTIDGNFMFINEEDDQPAQATPTQPAAAQPAQTPAQAPAQDYTDVSTPDPEIEKYNKFLARINKATDIDMLDADATLISEFSEPDDRETLTAAYKARRAELTGDKPRATRRAMNVE